MLKLFNKEHVAIGALTDLKDYKIEYLLSGEDLVEFSLSISDENIHLVEEEGYIRNKLNEYVIKAIDPSQNFKRFSCVVNVESIKGKSIANFDTSNNNITDTIRLAIAGTGWILADNNITKRRTVRLKNTNALEVLREVRKVFRVDFRFDAINKIIHVYESFGSDKGVYFSDELNLRSLDIPSDTYDYATRIIPKGKDGLTISSINSGKDYIDNFQYSNKVIEHIWEDNRYTDINSLKTDAEAKLAELSKPKRSYQASISDLAKQSKEYEFLDFFLGDTITLLSKQEKFRDKQRIVKYIQYPNNPSSNTCELGNTQLTFEDLQKENEAKNNIVDNITSDNGTVDGSKVDNITTDQISDFEASVGKITDLTVVNAKIENLEATNVTITGKLTAIEGEFGTLKANVGVIDNLTVTHTAQINDLKANSATITQLEAVNAKIGTVEAEVGKIQTLVNGNLSSENIQAGGITSDSLTIKNGFITNAMIANLDVSKVNAGDISTNKFKIKSDDGGIEIVGATQQFKDKNNRVRIQMGKDTQGNFNFIIRGEDGTTTLIDHTGVKSKAIADNLIVDNMIASDAVGEKQINYSSFATGFNKDTNTSTIKSTKIHLNNQNQTLDVAFNSLKTQADETKSLTESHSTTIGVMQGQITTAINNTQIVKDGQTILLKDDYNRTVATVDSMKSTIGSHTTTINEHTGKITGVETKVNIVERDLNSITARVSSSETNIATVTNIANENKNEISSTKSKVSTIETNLSGITSRVSTVETKQITTDGKVTSLETWKKEAEVKITDSAIISTVSSQFYNKGQTDSKYATQSALTQTEKNFEFKIVESGGENLLKNSAFKNGVQFWLPSRWGDNQFGTHEIQSLQPNVDNWTPRNRASLRTRVIAINSSNAGKPLRAGFDSHYFNVKGSTEYTLSCLLSAHRAKSITIEMLCYDSNGNRISGNNAISINPVKEGGIDRKNWSKVKHTFRTQSNASKCHIRCFMNEWTGEGDTAYMWFCEPIVVEGNKEALWTPNSNELYSGVTTIDAEGVKVTHSDGSHTRMNSREFYSTNTSGQKRYGVRRGGLWGYNISNGNANFCLTSTSSGGGQGSAHITSKNNSHYYAISGSSNFANDDSIANSNPYVWFIYNGFDSGGLTNVRGTHFTGEYVYLWTELHARQKVHTNVGIYSGGAIELKTGSSYPHTMANMGGDKMGIFGDNGVYLGIKAGTTNKTGIEIYEGSSLPHAQSYLNWNFNNYKLSKCQVSATFEARSLGLKRQQKINNDIYELQGVNSYSRGEFTYTVSEKQIIPFGESELMIEIPQILSENMELDYHVSISKESFGDYRIKEKNPYYFIIETDKIDSNFKFTYQLVCKEIEKSYNQAIIANNAVNMGNEVIEDAPIECKMPIIEHHNNII